MSDPQLDWGHAEVRDGKLTLPLTTKPRRAWAESFEKTVRLLGRGDWKKVALKKHGIRVTGVQPGTEDKLRHFLESAVMQANEEHGTREQAQPADDAAKHDSDAPDAQMTERFRAFAATAERDDCDGAHTADRFLEPNAGTPT